MTASPGAPDPLDREAIRSAVVGALAPRAEAAGLRIEDVGGSFDILGSGVVDSMGFVELLLGVEAALGRPIELERLSFAELTSLDGLVEELHALQGGTPNSGTDAAQDGRYPPNG
jgi:acyl carrier protein